MTEDNSPAFIANRIGEIGKGIDGTTVYFQVIRLDDDTTPAEVEDYLAPFYKWGSEDNHPSALTCNGITATQVRSNECICMVSLSYNNWKANNEN